MTAVVVNEPDIYAPDSPHSFYRDVYTVASRSGGMAAAEDRLGRYANSLAEGDGREAREARRIWAEAYRGELRAGEKAEQRAMTSGAASAGSFITPLYLTDLYQAWNEFAPSVALACTQADLPAFGMTVSVPQVTATDPTPIQASENTAVENDPTAQYDTANLSTFFGYTDVSQQLFDRAGPTAVDKMIFQQLRQSMWNKIDAATVAAIIAAVPGPNQLTRTTATSPVTSGLWSDINHGASLIEAGAGVRVLASHVFMSPNRFRFTAATVDNQGRPILVPDGNLPPDFPRGFTGYRIASTGVYTDGAVPAVGANDQILVANPAATVLAYGAPYLSAIPETKANQLTVGLRLYCYAAPVVRLPGAAATITGAAYPTAVTWP